MRFRYQDEDTAQTLREGLTELRATIADFIDGGQDYVDHDVLHVLYGLDTSLRSEGLLDVITLFGTDCSLRTYAQLVRRPESQALIRSIGWRRLAWTLVTIWPQMLVALVRTLRQRKRWPYTRYEERLDVSLRALREEFGIQVPRA